MRVEFSLQGMTGIQAFDGTTAWQVMPFMGKPDPEPMPEEMAKAFREEAESDDALMDYKEKGISIEVMGKEASDGAQAYKLKLTKGDGQPEYFYIDTERFLPIKHATKRKLMGNEVEIETTLGDYKDIGGLKFAHSIATRMAGMPAGQSMVFEKIELNLPIDDARFKMPEKKPEEKKTPDKGSEEEKQPGS